VIFSFDPVNDAFRIKMNFTLANGSNPTGDLIQATNGKLYGMTESGGNPGGGTIFEYDISNSSYFLKINFK
jgi:uncharacterized repeat protein (TIGR03803 family)